MAIMKLTDMADPSQDDIRAVLNEIFDFFGGVDKTLEITGHSSGRRVVHTWAKQGIPSGVAFAFEVLSHGAFKAGDISHAALSQIKICQLHQQIAAEQSNRKPRSSVISG